MARKVYVSILASIDTEGHVRPHRIRFENGEVYAVDRVRQVCRAAATKVGGTGMRYTVVIGGRETFLFEDEGRWFVEARA